MVIALFNETMAPGYLPGSQILVRAAKLRQRAWYFYGAVFPLVILAVAMLAMQQ
jgi:hypothetical protein